MATIKDTLEYQVAGYYLPYIINGDVSSLDTDEIIEVEAFLEEIVEANPGQIIYDCDGNGGDEFTKCAISGLMALTHKLKVVVMG
jgi:hypothetical protein